jgi:phospholipid/cholesterol/gamma-HCH transport system substrate-binding protein
VTGRNREFVVGVVFFALLGLLAVITLNLASVRLGATHEETFLFDRVQGLDQGAEVWVNGLPQGTVREVTLRPDGRIEARAEMKVPLESLDLRSDASVLVKSKSALGGAVLSVVTGKAPAKGDAASLRAKVWTAEPDAFGAIGEKVSELGDEVRGLVKDIREGQGTVARLLNDKKMADDLAASVADLRSVASRLEKGEGSAGKFLRDDSLYTKLDDAAARFDRLMASLEKQDGTLGRLLHDKAMGDDIAASAKSLREVSGKLERGEGSLGKLLSDGALYEDLRAAAGDIREFSADLKDGKGLLGRLVSDEALAKDTTDTLADMRSVVADLRAGKGTLGKLLTDDSVFNDLQGALKSLRMATEETRENAPILTFAGFLFRTY